MTGGSASAPAWHVVLDANVLLQAPIRDTILRLAELEVVAMAAVNNPSRNIFSQEIVGAPWRTTGAAVLTIGMALGWASSAAAGGFIIATVGFDGLFSLSAALAALAALLALGYRRKRPVPIAAPSPTT